MKKARKYSSPIVKKILANISKEEYERIESEMMKVAKKRKKQ